MLKQWIGRRKLSHFLTVDINNLRIRCAVAQLEIDGWFDGIGASHLAWRCQFKNDAWCAEATHTVSAIFFIGRATAPSTGLAVTDMQFGRLTLFVWPVLRATRSAGARLVSRTPQLKGLAVALPRQ